MKPDLHNALEAITFGGTQQFRNVAVTPLFSDEPTKLTYTTLSKALQSGRFAITELSEGGSVPELKLVSELDEAVLLLDGEELTGAKQNRVLNATILADAYSRLVIPVSCTEQGRWSYTSSRFDDSNVVMSAAHRAEKSVDVRRSLEQNRSYRSDQSAVWQRVGEMQSRLGIHSGTGAMRDVYEQSRNRLEGFAEAFPCQSGQKGLAVAVDGSLVGLEFVSQSEAYSLVHPKLVQSYAMDALLGAANPAPPEASSEDVAGFIEQLVETRETRHESVGLGWDYRYAGTDGEGSRLVGSALVVDDEPVHAAFFKLRSDGHRLSGRMAGYSRRSGYRSGDA